MLPLCACGAGVLALLGTCAGLQVMYGQLFDIPRCDRGLNKLKCNALLVGFFEWFVMQGQQGTEISL